jgi:hypothetical protein
VVFGSGAATAVTVGLAGCGDAGCTGGRGAPVTACCGDACCGRSVTLVAAVLLGRVGNAPNGEGTSGWSATTAIW